MNFEIKSRAEAARIVNSAKEMGLHGVKLLTQDERRIVQAAVKMLTSGEKTAKVTTKNLISGTDVSQWKHKDASERDITRLVKEYLPRLANFIKGCGNRFGGRIGSTQLMAECRDAKVQTAVNTALKTATPSTTMMLAADQTTTSTTPSPASVKRQVSTPPSQSVAQTITVVASTTIAAGAASPTGAEAKAPAAAKDQSATTPTTLTSAEYADTGIARSIEQAPLAQIQPPKPKAARQADTGMKQQSTQSAASTAADKTTISSKPSFLDIAKKGPQPVVDPTKTMSETFISDSAKPPRTSVTQAPVQPTPSTGAATGVAPAEKAVPSATPKAPDQTVTTPTTADQPATPLKAMGQTATPPTKKSQEDTLRPRRRAKTVDRFTTPSETSAPTPTSPKKTVTWAEPISTTAPQASRQAAVRPTTPTSAAGTTAKAEVLSSAPAKTPEEARTHLFRDMSTAIEIASKMEGLTDGERQILDFLRTTSLPKLNNQDLVVSRDWVYETIINCMGRYSAEGTKYTELRSKFDSSEAILKAELQNSATDSINANSGLISSVKMALIQNILDAIQTAKSLTNPQDGNNLWDSDFKSDFDNLTGAELQSRQLKELVEIMKQLNDRCRECGVSQLDRVFGPILSFFRIAGAFEMDAVAPVAQAVAEKAEGYAAMAHHAVEVLHAQVPGASDQVRVVVEASRKAAAAAKEANLSEAEEYAGQAAKAYQELTDKIAAAEQESVLSAAAELFRKEEVEAEKTKAAKLKMANAKDQANQVIAMVGKTDFYKEIKQIQSQSFTIDPKSLARINAYEQATENWRLAQSSDNLNELLQAASAVRETARELCSYSFEYQEQEFADRAETYQIPRPELIKFVKDTPLEVAAEEKKKVSDIQVEAIEDRKVSAVATKAREQADHVIATVGETQFYQEIQQVPSADIDSESLNRIEAYEQAIKKWELAKVSSDDLAVLQAATLVCDTARELCSHPFKYQEQMLAQTHQILTPELDPKLFTPPARDWDKMLFTFEKELKESGNGVLISIGEEITAIRDFLVENYRGVPVPNDVEYAVADVIKMARNALQEPLRIQIKEKLREQADIHSLSEHVEWVHEAHTRNMDAQAIRQMYVVQDAMLDLASRLKVNDPLRKLVLDMVENIENEKMFESKAPQLSTSLVVHQKNILEGMQYLLERTGPVYKQFEGRVRAIGQALQKQDLQEMRSAEKLIQEERKFISKVTDIGTERLQPEFKLRETLTATNRAFNKPIKAQAQLKDQVEVVQQIQKLRDKYEALRAQTSAAISAPIHDLDKFKIITKELEKLKSEIATVDWDDDKTVMVWAAKQAAPAKREAKLAGKAGEKEVSETEVFDAMNAMFTKADAERAKSLKKKYVEAKNEAAVADNKAKAAAKAADQAKAKAEAAAKTGPIEMEQDQDIQDYMKLFEGTPGTAKAEAEVAAKAEATAKAQAAAQAKAEAETKAQAFDAAKKEMEVYFNQQHAPQKLKKHQEEPGALGQTRPPVEERLKRDFAEFLEKTRSDLALGGVSEMFEKAGEIAATKDKAVKETPRMIKDFINTAYSYKPEDIEFSIEDALGKTLGSLSSDNRELKGIRDKNYSAANAEEIAKSAEQAIELIERAFKNKNVPIEEHYDIVALITNLRKMISDLRLT